MSDSYSQLSTLDSQLSLIPDPVRSKKARLGKSDPFDRRGAAEGDPQELGIQAHQTPGLAVVRAEARFVSGLRSAKSRFESRLAPEAHESPRHSL